MARDDDDDEPLVLQLLRLLLVVVKWVLIVVALPLLVVLKLLSKTHLLSSDYKERLLTKWMGHRLLYVWIGWLPRLLAALSVLAVSFGEAYLIGSVVGSTLGLSSGASIGLMFPALLLIGAGAWAGASTLKVGDTSDTQEPLSASLVARNTVLSLAYSLGDFALMFLLFLGVITIVRMPKVLPWSDPGEHVPHAQLTSFVVLQPFLAVVDLIGFVLFAAIWLTRLRYPALRHAREQASGASGEYSEVQLQQRLAVLQQFLGLLMDLPALLCGCLVYCTFYRVGKMRHDLAQVDIENRPEDRRRVWFKHFVSVLLDIPSAAVAAALLLLAPWRLYNLVRQRRQVDRSRDSADAELRSIAFAQLVLVPCDCAGVLAFVLVTITMYRRGTMQRKFREASAKFLLPEASSTVSQQTVWHGIALAQLVSILVDLPFFFLGAVAALSLYRFGNVVAAFKQDHSDFSEKRPLLLNEFVALLCDLPYALVFVATCLTAPWRLYPLLTRERKLGTTHKWIWRHFVSGLLDLPALLSLVVLHTVGRHRLSQLNDSIETTVEKHRLLFEGQELPFESAKLLPYGAPAMCCLAALCRVLFDLPFVFLGALVCLSMQRRDFLCDRRAVLAHVDNDSDKFRRLRKCAWRHFWLAVWNLLHLAIGVFVTFASVFTLRIFVLLGDLHSMPRRIDAEEALSLRSAEAASNETLPPEEDLVRTGNKSRRILVWRHLSGVLWDVAGTIAAVLTFVCGYYRFHRAKNAESLQPWFHSCLPGEQNARASVPFATQKSFVQQCCVLVTDLPFVLASLLPLASLYRSRVTARTVRAALGGDGSVSRVRLLEHALMTVMDVLSLPAILVFFLTGQSKASREMRSYNKSEDSNMDESVLQSDMPLVAQAWQTVLLLLVTLPVAPFFLLSPLRAAHVAKLTLSLPQRRQRRLARGYEAAVEDTSAAGCQSQSAALKALSATCALYANAFLCALDFGVMLMAGAVTVTLWRLWPLVQNVRADLRNAALLEGEMRADEMPRDEYFGLLADEWCRREQPLQRHVLREFARAIVALPFAACLALLLLVPWKHGEAKRNLLWPSVRADGDQTQEQFMDEMDTRRLTFLLSLISSALMDIPAIMMLAVLLVTWRHREARDIVCGSDVEDVTAASHRFLAPWQWRALRETAQLLRDVPFFVFGVATCVVSPLRLVGTLRAMAKVDEAEADRARRVRLRRRGKTALADAWCVVCLVPLLLLPWRLGSLLSALTNTDGCDDSTSEVPRRHREVMRHCKDVLLDVPFVLLATVVLLTVVRMPSLLRDVYLINSKYAQRRTEYMRRCARHHVMLLVIDLVTALAALPLLVSLYRLPALYRDLKGAVRATRVRKDELLDDAARSTRSDGDGVDDRGSVEINEVAPSAPVIALVDQPSSALVEKPSVEPSAEPSVEPSVEPSAPVEHVVDIDPSCDRLSDRTVDRTVDQTVAVTSDGASDDDYFVYESHLVSHVLWLGLCLPFLPTNRPKLAHRVQAHVVVWRHVGGLLLDLPLVLLLLPLLVVGGAWRLPALVMETACDTRTAPQRRRLLLRHVAGAVLDLPFLVLATLSLVLAPWRIGGFARCFTQHWRTCAECDARRRGWLGVCVSALCDVPFVLLLLLSAASPLRFLLLALPDLASAESAQQRRRLARRHFVLALLDGAVVVVAVLVTLSVYRVRRSVEAWRHSCGLCLRLCGGADSLLQRVLANSPAPEHLASDDFDDRRKWQLAQQAHLALLSQGGNLLLDVPFVVLFLVSLALAPWRALRVFGDLRKRGYKVWQCFPLQFGEFMRRQDGAYAHYRLRRRREKAQLALLRQRGQSDGVISEWRRFLRNDRLLQQCAAEVVSAPTLVEEPPIASALRGDAALTSRVLQFLNGRDVDAFAAASTWTWQQSQRSEIWRRCLTQEFDAATRIMAVKRQRVFAEKRDYRPAKDWFVELSLALQKEDLELQYLDEDMDNPVVSEALAKLAAAEVATARQLRFSSDGDALSAPEEEETQRRVCEFLTPAEAQSLAQESRDLTRLLRWRWDVLRRIGRQAPLRQQRAKTMLPNDSENRFFGGARVVVLDRFLQGVLDYFVVLPSLLVLLLCGQYKLPLLRRQMRELGAWQRAAVWASLACDAVVDAPFNLLALALLLGGYYRFALLRRELRESRPPRSFALSRHRGLTVKHVALLLRDCACLLGLCAVVLLMPWRLPTVVHALRRMYEGGDYRCRPRWRHRNLFELTRLVFVLGLYDLADAFLLGVVLLCILRVSHCWVRAADVWHQVDRFRADDGAAAVRAEGDRAEDEDEEVRAEAERRQDLRCARLRLDRLELRLAPKSLTRVHHVFKQEAAQSLRQLHHVILAPVKLVGVLLTPVFFWLRRRARQHEALQRYLRADESVRADVGADTAVGPTEHGRRVTQLRRNAEVRADAGALTQRLRGGDDVDKSGVLSELLFLLFRPERPQAHVAGPSSADEELHKAMHDALLAALQSDSAEHVERLVSRVDGFFDVSVELPAVREEPPAERVIDVADSDEAACGELSFATTSLLMPPAVLLWRYCPSSPSVLWTLERVALCCLLSLPALLLNECAHVLTALFMRPLLSGQACLWPGLSGLGDHVADADVSLVGDTVSREPACAERQQGSSSTVCQQAQLLLCVSLQALLSLLQLAVFAALCAVPLLYCVWTDTAVTWIAAAATALWTLTVMLGVADLTRRLWRRRFRRRVRPQLLPQLVFLGFLRGRGLLWCGVAWPLVASAKLRLRLRGNCVGRLLGELQLLAMTLLWVLWPPLLPALLLTGQLALRWSLSAAGAVLSLLLAFHARRLLERVQLLRRR